MAKAKGWFGLGRAPRWVGAAVIVIGLLSMAGGIGGGINQGETNQFIYAPCEL